MRARVWLAGVLALAGLSAGAATLRADDTTFRLAMPAKPQAGPVDTTVNLALTPDKDADTIDVRGWHGGWHGGWGHGWGGGWHGGWGRGLGWGYGGRYYGGFGRWGGYGWGGYGWGRPYYYSSYSYYPRYYGGYGLGLGGYGWGGLYGGISYSSYYSYPYYGGYYGGYSNPYCYWIANTAAPTPVVNLGINSGRVIPSQILTAANPYATPSIAANPYLNPYAGTVTPAPAAPPATQDQTYPYDGGPQAPVPLPQQTTPQQPAPVQPMTTPPTLPLEGRSVSLPVQKTQFAYPAYGEAPRATNFAGDREAKTYLTRSQPTK